MSAALIAPSALERIRRRFPEMAVGAGTVVTREQAQRCLDLGVSFAVAPGFNPETVRLFAQAGIGVALVEGAAHAGRAGDGLPIAGGACNAVGHQRQHGLPLRFGAK